MARRLALSLALGLASACAADDAATETATSDASSTGGSTTESTTDTSSAGDHVQIGPTDGPLALDFAVRITGEGGPRIGAIAVDGGLGTVEIDGALLPVVPYRRQPWSDFSLTLFQGLVVAPDRWYVVWFYCSGGALSDVWFEGTEGTAPTYESAQGSCEELAGAATPNVHLPAVDMPYPSLTDGLVLAGPDVAIHGASPGWLRLPTAEMIVLAFQRVDCTTECGAPGWWEYHAILWDPARGRACFAIFYMIQGSGDVLVTYALTLPDLSDPAGELALEATWTVDGVGP